jgi:DNA modification methylase
VTVRILNGDCRDMLKSLPDESVHCVVTSPPYWGLRDYGVEGQLGLEATPQEYVERMVEVFAHVGRVLRADGTLWLNLGDSYSSQAGQRKVTDRAGIKQQSNVASVNAPSRCVEGLGAKQLVGIPWRVAFALQAAGWYLRQDIIWAKPNPMPESVRDRCTKAHEYLFLLAKSERYYYDQAAIAEEGVGRETYFGSDRYSEGSGRHDSGSYNNAECDTRNKRSVWTVTTQPFREAHFATFPPALIEPCILAGCPEGGTVLDPFGGAGTTGLVADRLKRNAILIELNHEYADMARKRIFNDAPLFADVA